MVMVDSGRTSEMIYVRDGGGGSGTIEQVTKIFAFMGELAQSMPFGTIGKNISF